jgi:hypothetical protein
MVMEIPLLPDEGDAPVPGMKPALPVVKTDGVLGVLGTLASVMDTFDTHFSISTP